MKWAAVSNEDAGKTQREVHGLNQPAVHAIGLPAGNASSVTPRCRRWATAIFQPRSRIAVEKTEAGAMSDAVQIFKQALMAGKAAITREFAA